LKNIELDTLVGVGHLHPVHEFSTIEGLSPINGISGMRIQGEAEKRAGGSKQGSLPYRYPKSHFGTSKIHTDRARKLKKHNNLSP
jgi:hypothetical protein